MAEKMVTFSVYGPQRLKEGLEKMAGKQKRTLSQQACFILEPVVNHFLQEHTVQKQVTLKERAE